MVVIVIGLDVAPSTFAESTYTRHYQAQQCDRRQTFAASSAGVTGSGNRSVVAAVAGARVVTDFDLLVGEHLGRTFIEQLVDAVTEHDVS